MRLSAFNPFKVFAAVFLITFAAVAGYGLATRPEPVAADPDPEPASETAPVGKERAQARVPALEQPPAAGDANNATASETPGNGSPIIVTTPGPGGVTVHKVQAGETLYAIARRYSTSVAALRAANGLKSDQIRVGQELKIEAARETETSAPRTHKVLPGESLWEIAVTYSVTVEDLINANKQVDDPGMLQIGQVVNLPERASAGTDPAPGGDIAHGGLFQWPVAAPVSSYYGPRWGRNHNGIDLAANQGTPIKAARDGKVSISGVLRGYGNTVIIDHPDGSRTLYAHCERLMVKAGQTVKQGQVIATVGSTGHSTGPHLHFEIHVANRTRNPLDYLPSKP